MLKGLARLNVVRGDKIGTRNSELDQSWNRVLAVFCVSIVERNRHHEFRTRSKQLRLTDLVQ